MTTKNNIPKGYKDSAVGIIPKEWRVKTLSECFYISAGRDLQKEYFSKTSTNTHCYPIFSNSLDNKGLYGYTSHPRYKAGSITITGRGMLGVAEYRKIDFDAIVRLLVLFPKLNITGELITEYINFKKPFYFECTGVPQLTAPQIANIQIPIPPLEEQKKIAEILSTWDEAIEKQSKLIEKLELRKRGIMQRLLTGRTRLPNFTTPWQKVKLGDCFKHITDTSNGHTYLPMTISARLGLISQQDKFDRVIAGDSLKKYTHIKNGDFAYNKGNSNLYEMGCIYRLKEQDAVVPFVYICFRPLPNVCGEFYQHYFINHGLDRQLKKIITSGARGDGLLNVDKNDFFDLEIIYPSLPEQKAIAEVLTTADDEIATHRKKLDTLRQQKRGLMQQLLTGKTRVKI